MGNRFKERTKETFSGYYIYGGCLCAVRKQNHAWLRTSLLTSSPSQLARDYGGVKCIGLPVNLS